MTTTRPYVETCD